MNTKKSKSKKSVVTLQDLRIDFYNPVTILLVGCGGTGSLMLSGLARMNEALNMLRIGSLFVNVMDDDIFTETNLGRQTCSASDIGEFKAKVSVERVNRYYGNDWTYDIKRFENEGRQFDIIISAVDNVKSRLSIFKKTATIVDIGTDNDYGQVIMSKKDLMPNTQELFDIKSIKEENTHSCSMAEALGKQDLFVNTFASMYACQMLYKLFTDRYVEYNQVYFSMNPMNVKTKFQTL